MEVLPILGLPILAHDNVKKYMGIPNCLTITSISNKNCFQYAGVSLTELINENSFWPARNFSTVSFRMYLKVAAAIEPGLNLYIANFIDKRKWRCSQTNLAKNT